MPATAMAQERITIFAAASMKDAMDRAAVAFEQETGTEVVVSFAASSALARQIEAGAPADVFISADLEWMDWLAERNLIREESRRPVAANALVIVAAKPVPEGAEPGDILSKGRFAMGDPTHVPAGRYAQAALTSLGLWEEVKEHAVFGENVRVALELAERGEVAAAIVYGSDERASNGLSRVYTFPADRHPPVVYPAAAMANAGPEADAFLDFLSGEEGQRIFRELGFAQPPV
ncbi:molybdate ABC transporter substrate-binding protein [Chelativorans sp. AA-79]|uniref:molybdate ABC transporter substrate-binding protein n=1 Tax=Chelativorans sp. AA-79 TaxID=3028735 RepID=UPI0023F8AC76|nr:molybdate ABC transporter substrate-binding protein [Chelativorans sp. AA-79]WEX11808.1 molybdate ABC transporter substrate-binding protein [Chelativorans sp. AA-79]